MRPTKIDLVLTTLLGIFLSSGSYSKAWGTTIILGDSISTGAVSHPHFKFSSRSVLEAIVNPRVVIPLRNHLINADLFNIWERRVESPFRPDASQIQYRVDTPEYAWGNLVARGMGELPEDILVGAIDGARTVNAKDQLQKLLANKNQNQTIKNVFFLFTGNDLCKTDFEENDYVPKSSYKQHLIEALELLERNTDPIEPINVFLVPHLNLMQLLRSQKILDKKIPLSKSISITCNELIVGSDRRQLRRNLLYRYYRPKKVCRGLYSDFPNSTHWSFLSDLLAKYQEAIYKISKMQKWQWTHLRVLAVNDTETLVFDENDIAIDCFHLSTYGQQKLAKFVLDRVQPFID